MELTFDHVVPVAQGGRKDWENIVTCCIGCNRRKGGRTPAEAGMRLLRPPRRPDSAPAIRITIGIGLRNAPESWRDYLYWNVELDQESDRDVGPRDDLRAPGGPLKGPASRSSGSGLEDRACATSLSTARRLTWSSPRRAASSSSCRRPGRRRA